MYINNEQQVCRWWWWGGQWGSGDADGEKSEVTAGQMGVARSAETGDGDEREQEGGEGTELLCPAVLDVTFVDILTNYFQTVANQRLGRGKVQHFATTHFLLQWLQQ